MELSAVRCRKPRAPQSMIKRAVSAAATSDEERFLKGIVSARADKRSGYATALREISSGCKTSHWIWCVLQQSVLPFMGPLY